MPDIRLPEVSITSRISSLNGVTSHRLVLDIPLIYGRSVRGGSYQEHDTGLRLAQAISGLLTRGEAKRLAEILEAAECAQREGIGPAP